MEKPVSAQKSPYKVKVEKDKTYFWCACGLSQKQPFCDGSHKKEGKFKSLKYFAAESKEVLDKMLTYMEKKYISVLWNIFYHFG